jgi:hypothetical protein
MLVEQEIEAEIIASGDLGVGLNANRNGNSI